VISKQPASHKKGGMIEKDKFEYRRIVNLGGRGSSVECVFDSLEEDYCLVMIITIK
jgi:hypothetical protein